MFEDEVLDVAASVPDAIKLMATLADVADDPTFIEITSKYQIIMANKTTTEAIIGFYF